MIACETSYISYSDLPAGSPKSKTKVLFCKYIFLKLLSFESVIFPVIHIPIEERLDIKISIIKISIKKESR